MENDTVAATEHQQILISTFLDIAVGQTVHTATQFLQATGWQLEEAIQLFYVGNETGAVASSSEFSPLINKKTQIDEILSGSGKQWGHEHASPHNESTVRAPLPVKKDVLYDEEMFYKAAARLGYLSHEDRLSFHNSNQELKPPGIWAADQSSASVVDNSRDNLASLYSPPFALMLQGPFEKAKDAAKDQNKWLLVNLQSTREFSSHMLNRDTWANEAVAQTISSNFIFWQVNDDTEEGSKVCTHYKLDSSPIVLVVDPVTGQKMRSWKGMVQPETLLEDLIPFMDGSPKDHHASLSNNRTRETFQAYGSKEEDEELLLALAASMEGIEESSGVSKDIDISNAEEEMCKTKKPTYPPLPEEPKADRNLLCRVGVRLPDGRRVQRNFLLTDPIQLLWSFCNSQLDEADARHFRLNQAIPGASKFLEYESNLTFDESGLSNSMISVTWD
ncbi:UBX domain-containing protein [Heracleum sosnowskyi]|uniref:UBX domain-containing protein n=1 Tax=Heracleum sosnowskyi TaxID=360622 RepID=A0AAD8MU96_9APIA|nr:UBX domain-containing protein [Heracleum sosnowskyi]